LGGAGAAAKRARTSAKTPIAAAVFQPPAMTPQQISMEEGKLRRVEESIRVFVRVADPKYRQVVPMRFFNLTLTTEEADAYNAGYLEEKSLRADLARTLIQLVSISARIITEMEELKRCQSMSSLWKLHADALVVLLDIASTVTEDAGSSAKLAGQSDAAAMAKAIHGSVQKLRAYSDAAVKTMAQSGS
jgi:hypothetical protein